MHIYEITISIYASYRVRLSARNLIEYSLDRQKNILEKEKIKDTYRKCMCKDSAKENTQMKIYIL